MKKEIFFYRNGNTIYAVNVKCTNIAMATCGKTDNFNLIFGMRLAALRLCADPMALTDIGYANIGEFMDAHHAKYIDRATFCIAKSALYTLHTRRTMHFAVALLKYERVIFGRALDADLLAEVHTKLIFEDNNYNG